MGRILEHWRVPIAVFFSAALIVGAYVLARGVGSPSIAQASTETALLQAIATRDSNGDGLPDWEKVLYGIPINATTTDYFHLGMTDGEAVAKGLVVPKAVADVPVATSTAAVNVPAEGTLTDTFAKNFFTLYITAKEANGGDDLTDDQVNALADQAMNQFLQTVTSPPDFKTITDLNVSGTGPDALRAFAIAAEGVFKKNMGSATTSELQSLQDAVLNNDATALSQLAAASQIYQNYAVGLAALPVPQDLAADDLALINAMMLRSEADDNLAHVNTDPLTAIVALQQFSQTESSFWNAFADIGAIYASAGVVLPNGTPGSSLVNVIANARETSP
ncbi:MAG: hypothetical protein ABSB00_01635 [Minisyncoccia bacterium]|jgi:hypothetical protein